MSILSEEIKCYHCDLIFYLHSFRLREAKTITCMYCNNKIIKEKIKK